MKTFKNAIKISAIIVICTIPPVIFHFIEVSSKWMDFLGNYISALVGALTTFIAFFYTYKQNEKQNNEIMEQNKQIQEQNIFSQKRQEERLRLQDLPFINADKTESKDISECIYFDTNGHIFKNDNDKKNISWFFGGFNFINIGVAPAIDVKISDNNMGHISVLSMKGIEINFPSSVDYLELPITYFDREYRQYNQTLKLNVIKGYTSMGIEMHEMNVVAITPPLLVNDANK